MASPELKIKSSFVYVRRGHALVLFEVKSI